MAGFDITLDATALSYKAYLIIASGEQTNLFPPNAGGWTATTQAYTVALSPGAYIFQVGSGSTDTFAFTVTSTGKIAYDPSYAAFLSGEGTSKLVILGYKVTFDARYITGQVYFEELYDGSSMALTLATLTMVPMGDYTVGNQTVCAFSFGIDVNGKFTYSESYDISQNGFLQGKGTSTLAFLGYPLLIDARNAGGTGVILQPVSFGVPSAMSGVEYVSLLPFDVSPLGPGYALQFGNVPVSTTGFDLDLTGGLKLHGELPYTLAVDSFHGLKRLSVGRIHLEEKLPVSAPLK